MRTIYEPTGKAREYSPLAVNFYNGCDHGCVYCYAPSLQFKSRADYLNVTPREGLLDALEKDAKKWEGTDKQEAPDGRRYKACGNSMAVPVMKFIGQRIMDAEPVVFDQESITRILTVTPLNEAEMESGQQTLF